MAEGTIFDTSLLQLGEPGSISTVRNVSDYLIVQGGEGIQVLQVGSEGSLTPVSSIQRDNTGAAEIHSFSVLSETYVVGAYEGSGELVLWRLNADGSLVETDRVSSHGDTDILKPTDVSSVYGSISPIFVADSQSNALFVFDVSPEGKLTPTSAVRDSDSATLNLSGVEFLGAVSLLGEPYLIAYGRGDKGISVFRTEFDGSLINLSNSSDFTIFGDEVTVGDPYA